MDDLKRFINETVVVMCNRLVVALIILVVGHWFVKFIVSKFKKSRLVQRLDAAAQIYIKNAVSISLNIIVIVSAVGCMGVPLASVTAALGSVGLALGLALQGGLSNIAGGIILLFTHPFRIGDYVIIGDLNGTVEAIGIYYTEIITPDNQKVLIPNGTAANSEITNFSVKNIRRSCLEFSVSYYSDINKAKQILLNAAADNSLVLNDPEPVVFVSSHNESAVILTLQLWVKNENFRVANSQILQSVKEKFDEAKIEIPYRQLDVHIKEK